MSLFLLAIVSTAGAEIIYVDANASPGGDGLSWETAYKYLQDALYNAGSNPDVNEIRVARGTSKPDMDEAGNVTPGDREATFQLKNGVTIRGGYAGYNEPDPNVWDIGLYETILSGDLNGDDVGFTNNDENSYHVVTGNNTEPNAVLDGFTVTAGKTKDDGSADDYGGGMYNNPGSPTVTNCTFTKNYAGYGGGGMLNSSSSPTLTNCTFIENWSYWGGGLCNGSSNPILTNCTFIGNWGSGGGGIYNAGGSPTLTNCTFIGNSVNSTPEFIHNVDNSESKEIHPTFLYPPGGGMYNNGSSPTLVNCTFSGNSADYGGGMANNSYSSPTLVNCTFGGNSARLEGGGMWINYESTPTVNNCIMWADSAPTGAEIFLSSPTGIPSTLTVSYSDVQGGIEGVHVDSGCTLNWGTGNIMTDPLFVDSDGPDGNAGTEDDNLRLLAASPCIDAGNNTAVPEDTNDLDGDGDTTELIPRDFDNYSRFEDFPPPGGSGVAAPGYPHIVDMGAYERHLIIYVDNDASAGGDGATWETAFMYLQDALNDAEPGDEIWVASGTYYPDEDEGGNVTPNDRDATFSLINGVAVYGGFAGGESSLDEQNWRTNKSILSGDLDANDTQGLDPCDLPNDPNRGENSYHVVTGSEMDATTVLNGFTITAGNANGMPQHGGGMYNDSGSATVTNCIFTKNSAGQGGGMYNRVNSSPMVTNCIFSGNSARAGGGGMYNYGSNPTVTNCTFSMNYSGWSPGGGMSNFSFSRPTLTNCILWGNTTPQIYNFDLSWPNVRYCDVQGGWSGTGNIEEDPLFVDANGLDNIVGTEDDNLRLSPGSPCIDAGVNDAVPGGVTTDLDGRERFSDGDCNDTVIVDMGAYEFAWAYIGDFDYDCGVDFLDYAIFALAWLTEPGQTGWNPDCDISIPADSYINWDDLDVIADNWLAGTEPEL